MDRFTRRGLVALIAAVLIPPAVASAQYDEFLCPTRSTVYFQAEAVVLERFSYFANQPLVLDNAGTTLLSAGQVDFDRLQVGPKLLLGLPDEDQGAWEVSYFGTLDWQGSGQVSQKNSLRIPGDLGLHTLDYLGADTMQASYRSELNNVEFNRVQSYGDLSILGGFRYVTIDERFNLHSIDSDTGTSDYNIHSWNNLVGGQVGMRVRRPLLFLEWDFTAKAGLFGNIADQHTVLRDFNNTLLLRDVLANRTNFAFVGDLNLSATWHLGPALLARVGYNVMFVQGVALAPDQLDFTDTLTSSTGIDTSGGLFLHGASAGIEAHW